MLLQMARFHSFSRLSSIPLCVWTTPSLSVPVSGPLGRSLAIVNGDALSTGVPASFQIGVFSGCMLGSGFAGSGGSFIFSFLRKRYPVLHSGCSAFPPRVKEGSSFSTPSPASTVCNVFGDGHHDQCEVIPRCGVHLYFSGN